MGYFVHHSRAPFVEGDGQRGRLSGLGLMLRCSADLSSKLSPRSDWPWLRLPGPTRNTWSQGRNVTLG